MRHRRSVTLTLVLSACLCALALPSISWGVICSPSLGSTTLTGASQRTLMATGGGGRLYLSGADNIVHIVDPATHTVSTVNAPSNARMAYIASTNKVFGLGVIGGKGAPFTIDAANHVTTFSQLPLPYSPTGDIALDATHSRVYIGMRASDDVIMKYDLSTNVATTFASVTALYGQGVHTGRIAVDEALNRVYVAVFGSSTSYPLGVRVIQVFDGATGADLGQIPVDTSSMAIDQSTHRLYAVTDSGGAGGITVVDLLTNTVAPPPTTDAYLSGFVRIVGADFPSGRFWLRSGIRIVEVSTSSLSVASAFSFPYNGPDGGVSWDPLAQRLYAAALNFGSGFTTTRSVESFGDAPSCPRDQTSPTVSVGTPADGSHLQLGSTATLDIDCADEPGGLGISFCSGYVSGPGFSGRLFDGDSLPTGTAGDYDVFAEAVDWGGNYGSSDIHYSVVESIDQDSDGVDDPIDPNATDGAGAFDDLSGTTGYIVDRGGLAVYISDAAAPGGVRVVVGPGSGSATISACGFPVQVDAGSDATITCGSVTVAVATGSARVLLGGGVTVVSIPQGGEAKVTDLGGGKFSVANLGSVAITVTVDGMSATINPGATSTVAAWHFVGFSQPIDNLPTMNKVKAAQAVPVKWRLLNSSNAPVTTLASATITVTSLSCSSGATIDQIEETVAGASGLQNLGNGYYQLNWKSPTTYSNSCKTLHLNIGDGVTHDANFQFTK